MWSYEEFIADRPGGETSTEHSAATEHDCGTPGEAQTVLTEERATEASGQTATDAGLVAD